MITTWEQRARRDGIVLKQITSPCRRPPGATSSSSSQGDHAADPRHRGHPHHQPHRSDPARCANRAHGREHGIQVFVDGAHAFAHFRSSATISGAITTRQPAQVALRPDRHRLPVRPQGQDQVDLAADGGAPEMDEDIRKYEEIGTHPAANTRDRCALAFHRASAGRKGARLRWLRDRWAKRLAAADPRVRCSRPSTTRSPAGSASSTWMGRPTKLQA